MEDQSNSTNTAQTSGKVDKSNSIIDCSIRGWFGTLSDKFEDMEYLMGYEQYDTEEFLDIVDEIEEIIIDIKKL